MTSNGHTPSNRLDQIEVILARVAQQQEVNTAGIAELRNIVESNAKAIQANSTRIIETDQILSEAAGRTLRGLDELRERAEEDRVNLQEYRQRNDANVASLNAAVERLETIVTQLIHQNRSDQSS